MKRVVIAVSSVALLISGGAMTALANTAAASPVVRQTAPIPPGLHAVQVCGRMPADEAHCMSLVMVDAHGRMFNSPAPSGLGPADLQDAYKLPSATEGKGMKVALVDAYDDPNAEADMAVYRSTFGLPAVHHRQRLLQEGLPAGRHELPTAELGLGGGDLPRPGHGLGDLPEVPHPAGRGRRGQIGNLGHA